MEGSEIPQVNQTAPNLDRRVQKHPVLGMPYEPQVQRYRSTREAFALMAALALMPERQFDPHAEAIVLDERPTERDLEADRIARRRHAEEMDRREAAEAKRRTEERAVADKIQEERRRRKAENFAKRQPKK
jgi:hypothetical protein